jgi:hypothetical protein
MDAGLRRSTTLRPTHFPAPALRAAPDRRTGHGGRYYLGPSVADGGTVAPPSQTVGDDRFFHPAVL